MKKEENEIKTLFSICNKKFFNNSLSCVNFKINPNSKKTCYWSNKFFEIGFIENKQNFLISFLQELIHVENFQKKIQDVGTNSYHKKSFLEKALQIGFFVIKHKTKGWSLLCLEHPRNVIFEKFCIKPNLDSNKKLIEFFHSQNLNFEIIPAKKKNYTFKYVCKCPSHNTIRSGRDPSGHNPLSAKCLICNSNFEFFSDASQSP
jgi:hypothetical protein